MVWSTVAQIGLSLYGARQQQKAADRAASEALRIGAANAEIIERDIDIGKQQIVNLEKALEISNGRKRMAFGAVQGSVRNQFAGAGVDLGRGAPVTVQLKNAAEFEYELGIDAYNTSIAIQEVEDGIEETRMRAEVSRMGGAAEASALRSRGTQALLKGLGTSVAIADEEGMFSRDYWSSLRKSWSDG